MTTKTDADDSSTDHETIHDVNDLNLGDEVITSKGDAMDVKPLEVVNIQTIDGDTVVTIQGDWSNARKYDLTESKFSSPVMPDVGIVTVKRVSKADDEVSA
jgi:hypothetical protein